MSNENLKLFSAGLKELRESQEITLQQIHNRTRIDIKYLQAIEECNFEIMPEVYMKAFLKEYGQALGLDSEEVIAKFLAAKSGKQPEQDHKKEKKESSNEKVSNTYSDEDHFAADNFNYERKISLGTDQLFKIGALVLFAVIVAAVYFLFFNNSEQKIIKETPYEEVLKENEAKYEPVQKETPLVKAESDSLTLLINAVDTVWMKAEMDNVVIQEFIMYPGRTKNLRAKNDFLLNLGNAGGVELSLDGKTLDFKGVSGQVRTIKIDRDGWRYFSSKTGIKNAKADSTQN